MRPSQRASSKQTSKPANIPAPQLGINATKSLGRMNPEEAIYLFNLEPSEFGCRPRQGYREYANGWAGGANSDQARTVIAYDGSLPDNSADRLWVANRYGIWNMTARGETAPTQDVTFADNGTSAGECSYEIYQTDASYFLLVCDERNGYYTYSEAADTWLKVTSGVSAGQVSVGDPATFSFVTVFKERVWFIEKDTGNAWYLSVASIYGEATKFNFGRNFRKGGALVGMFNWTIDGGDGIDNYFVAASQSGDLVVYRGTDPDTAGAFSMTGVWNIGQLPYGHRFATEYGGEVFFLSSFGLLPLSQIMNGAATEDPSSYMTYKVAAFIRPQLTINLDDYGWQVFHFSDDGNMEIGAPPPDDGGSTRQYVFDYPTQAWSIARDIDMGHAATWQGKLYFTDYTLDKLWEFDGQTTVDKVHLDPDTDGVAVPITISSLSFYSPLEAPAQYKRVQYIRPMWVGGAVPVFTVQARYDYDIQEVMTTPALASNSETGFWDAGVFELSIWGGSQNASDNPRGANGMGRHVAVAMRGRSSEDVTLIGFDIIFDTGGLM